MDHILAWRVVGQRPPRRTDVSRFRCRRRHVRRCGLLNILQLQLELGDLALDLLRRAAELLAPQPRQLRLQPFDDAVALGQRHTLLQHQLAQLLGCLGKGGFEHVTS